MKIKKAISPLIATILLIVVAVALIAIVIAWGRSFTTDSLADTTGLVDTACVGSAINITNCSVTDGNMSFYIQNIGSKEFSVGDDFYVNVTNVDSLDSALNKRLDADLDEGFSSPLAPGQMHQVKIDLEDVDGADLTGGSNRFNVSVTSAFCPQDAKASVSNCN